MDGGAERTPQWTSGPARGRPLTELIEWSLSLAYCA